MSVLQIIKRVGFVIVLSCMTFLCDVLAGGQKITGFVQNYQGPQIFLTMLYGGNQYVVDTAFLQNNSYTFESLYHLQSGAYLVVLPPTSSFIMLVDQNDHDVTFKVDLNDINNSIEFTGSRDNTEYYNYLRFFESKRQFLDNLKKQYDTEIDEQDKLELLSKMQQLKKEITEYQAALVQRIPGTMTAAMVKCELPVDVPGFAGSPEEINMKKYLFQRQHFFDNVDLRDERLIRAPRNVIVDRVEFYLDHLTPQHPDSIIASVDYILAASEETPASYRFFLTHMFNKYRDSKSIGMDAVYVHIAEEYIAKGKASWIEETEKNAVLTAVSRVSPTLIGKKAPDFTVQTRDGKDLSLYDINSPYTVIFFWSPNCSNCQQSIPGLSEFYKVYKPEGVEVLAVCTKLSEQEVQCWDYVDKHQMPAWINASDKMGSSSVHSQYNITRTPKIYVLDKDKTIVAKDLGVEHLGEVINRLLK